MRQKLDAFDEAATVFAPSSPPAPDRGGAEGDPTGPMAGSPTVPPEPPIRPDRDEWSAEWRDAFGMSDAFLIFDDQPILNPVVEEADIMLKLADKGHLRIHGRKVVADLGLDVPGARPTEPGTPRSTPGARSGPPRRGSHPARGRARAYSRPRGRLQWQS